MEQPLIIPGLFDGVLSPEQVEKIAKAVNDLWERKAADAAREPAKVIPMRKPRSK